MKLEARFIIIKNIKWIICKEKNFVIERTKYSSKIIYYLLMIDVYKTPGM